MSKQKKWVIPDIDIDKALRISDELNISLLAAKILYSRGFSYENAKEFLQVDESVFHNPFLLNDMEKAVDRINSALKSNEKIAVYGDYDVDGITSTYILYDYLKSCGGDVIYYIPDRIAEGYGMNTGAIDTLKSANVELIITVDVGITAFKEAEYASSLGIDVVITDHHSLKDELPSAVAVVNPKITNAGYPFDSLAGVGVAFKLIYALSGLDKEIFNKYCAITAIGTIADMVSLKDENRYIASVGIESLKTTTNPGIKAILQVAGLNMNELSSSDISFGIAPRLNAAGRMADASESVELLLETSKEKALERAEKLDTYNRKRQSEEQVIFDEALQIISENNYYNDNFILVAKEGWANGITGIVSSKLTDKFYKPSAVVSINPDGSGKASGRSIKGINLFEILTLCSENLLKYGGHELAAGFTVKEGMLEAFRENINQQISACMTPEISTPSMNIDCEIELGDISLDNAHSLEVLEPYGIDNATPLFCIYNLMITSIRYTQNKKHAFITVKDSVNTRELPAFSMVSTVKKYNVGDYINVAGTIGINSFKGKVHAQFIVRDIQSSELNKCVSESELRVIFSDIRSKITRGINTFDKRVTITINNRQKIEIVNPKIQTALKIFSELNILNVTATEDGYNISEGVNFKTKNNLSASETFIKYNLPKPV